MKNKWLSIAKIFMATSLVSLGLQSKAAITPNPVFQSGMVLQRDVIVPIWGTATPSATITVTCNSVITTATADENGKHYSPQQPMAVHIL